MSDTVKGKPRPAFKRAKPSGRGVQSEHELAAKREAVKLIEKRIDHNERVRRSAARKRALANLGSAVVGVAVLAGIAWYFTHKHEGSLKPDVNLGEITKTAKECLPAAVADAVAPVVAQSTPASVTEAKFREQYAAVAATFVQGELSHWKDAPKELRPKNAPAGTAYYALVPQGGKFGLYEATAGGKIVELSPFGPPLELAADEFKKACGGKPYFIACANRVFVCGGGDLKMMDELRKALVPQ